MIHLKNTKIKHVSLKPPTRRNFFLKVVWVLFLVNYILLSAARTYALQSSVTATVPDLQAPSTPILISPEDDETITTAYPVFTWQQSTDNVGIDYYELTVDDSVLFTNIPTTATDNSQYTLTYASGTGYYTLTPKNPLNDGSHTWEVSVYDAADNSATSVNWTFSIDTLAPYFEITQIANQTVLIHTGDAGTVPSQPIHLADNEPLFSGTGEAGASVQLTITIPGDPTQDHTFSVEPNGTWSFQSGIFPRDVTITFDFVITDSAGNISVLSNLQIIIDPIIIIIPPASPSPTPTSSPTPSPITTPTATPQASPEVSPLPTISPTVSPVPSPQSSPLISITVIPPREIIFETIQEIIERMPQELLDILALVPESIVTIITEPIRAISPAGALVATVVIPSLGLLALLLQSGAQISLEFLIKLLQALGLLPVKDPQGMVYNSENNEPIPFALLTIQGQNGHENLFETVVTDEKGIYQGIKLPKGTYSITVSHQDFVFPTAKQKPYYLTQGEYYRGETFTVQDTNRQQLFLIPVDPKKELAYQKTTRSKLRLLVARVRLKNIIVPMFLLSLVFMLINPTVINMVIVGLYLVLFSIRLVKKVRKAAIVGKIVDTQGFGIANAIVRLSNPTTTELVTLVTTNKHGNFAIHCKPGKYYVSITKTGYIRATAEAAMSLDEVDATEKQAKLDLVLQQVTIVT